MGQRVHPQIVWGRNLQLTASQTGLGGVLQTQPIGFPRIGGYPIGSGTRCADWTQIALWSDTWKIAMQDYTCINLNRGAHSNADAVAAVTTIRNHNPDIVLFQYEDAWDITQDAGSYDQQNYNATLQQYDITGTGGAADGDGYARTVAGAQYEAWSGTWALNTTTYTGQVNGRYALEYIMEQRYYEFCQQSIGANFQGIVWDMARWITRGEEENSVDYDRDATLATYGNFDATAHPNAQIVAANIAGVDRVNLAYQADYGVSGNFGIGGNAGSGFDWWDGAHPYLGPTILDAAAQPANWPFRDGPNVYEHWGRAMGFNDDGTSSGPGNDFRRGFTALGRMRDYVNVCAANNTKIVVPQTCIPLDDPDYYTKARYLIAAQTIAGVYCNIENDATFGAGPSGYGSHREIDLFDEYVAGDVASMSTVEVQLNKHWGGLPVDADPLYGSVYVDGVQAGIIGGTGVYCRRFQGMFVLVNPEGNGTQIVTLPAGDFERFLGVQDASVNDGSVVGPTVTMNAGTGLFLVLSTEGQDVDFTTRATASSNVLYATNFDDVYLDGVWNSGRSGISSDAELIAEAADSPPSPENVSINTSIKLSGANSCRLTTPGNLGASGSGYFSFRPDGRTSTTRRDLYMQFAVYYPQETIGYRFNHDGDSYFKTVNCGQYGAGQVVIGDNLFSGFPVLLLDGFDTLGGDFYSIGGGDTVNPWGIATTRESPAIDNGAILDGSSTKEEVLNNWGVMPRGVAAQDGDYGYDSGDPYLYDRSGMVNGWPDDRSQASGAVPWQLDGWMVVEARLKYVDNTDSTIQIWAAPYGEQPVLMVDEHNKALLGTNTSNSWSRFELLNYATGRLAETGVRPTQYTYYDEIICSLDPIKFPNPGGTQYDLPQNAPQWIRDAIAAGWDVGEWAEISDTSPDFSLSATNRPRDVKSVNSSDPTFDGITNDWTGGGFASDMGSHGAYIIGVGGGHSSYGGNDVFSFDLSTRTWSEVWPDTSTGSTGNQYGEYADGSPLCFHTYFYPSATPALDGYPDGIYLVPKGVDSTSGQTPSVSVAYGHFIDLANPGNGWARLDEIPDSSTRIWGWAQSGAGVWDKTRDKYWLWSINYETGGHGDNFFASLDPLASAGNQWIDDRPANANDGHGWSNNGIDQAIVHDPDQDIIISFDFRNANVVQYLKPDNPSQYYLNKPTAWPITESGSAPSKTGAGGAGWSEHRDAAIWWPSFGSDEVYEFKYSSGSQGSQGTAGDLTYTWSSITAGTSTVTPLYNGEAGEYNRFQIVTYDDYEIAIAITNVDGPVYAFRIS